MKQENPICPECKKRLQGVDEEVNRRLQQMRPGNITLCVSCAAVLQMQTDRTFKTLTEEDLAELAKQDPALAFHITATRQLTRGAIKSQQNFKEYFENLIRRN